MDQLARRVEDHLVVEKMTITEPKQSLVFPSGLDSSQVTVVDPDLQGRTYRGVLLRGPAIVSLYTNLRQSLATEILYFGFSDPEAVEAVRLDLKYLEEDERFDLGSSCRVLQEVGDQVFAWEVEFCSLLSVNQTDLVCSCDNLTMTRAYNYGGFRSFESVQPSYNVTTLRTTTTTTTITTVPTTQTGSTSTSSGSSSSGSSQTTSILSTTTVERMNSTSSVEPCSWEYTKTPVTVSMVLLSLSLLCILLAFISIILFFK